MQKKLTAISPAWSAAACCAIGLCVAAGFLASDIHLTQTLKDATNYAMLAVALLAFAAGGALIRVNPPGLLLFTLAALSVQFIGLSPAIATVAFGLGCTAVGQRIARRFGVHDVLVSLFIGVFVVTGIIGWLLPYKLHTSLVYSVALTALLWLERRVAREILTLLFRGWTDATSNSKASASLALIAVFVSLTTAWLPTVLFDDLAYHAMLPAQLRHLGYYRFDVATQVWAIAPWGSDIVHAVVSVLTDSESRGAVNTGWFLLACCALWRFGTLIGLAKHWKWLSIALFASQPYISGLLGMAQVENELVPLTLVLAGLCVKISRDKDPNASYSVVILAGLFASLKSSQALVIAPLVLLCVPVFLKADPRRLLTACSIALVFCSSSYCYAWNLTGNPLLPLLNEYFKSPFYLPENFHDSRWSQGLNWRSVWDLTFDTGKYQEMYAGGAGISVLALSPFLLPALLIPPLRRTAIWLLLALLVMFSAIQYLRYIAPLLVVSIPIALVVVSKYLAPRIAAVGVVFLIVVNLSLIPASIWLLRNDLLRLQLTALMKKSIGSANKQIIENYAFESVVAAAILKDPTKVASVLLADKERPFMAEFAGQAFAESWYDVQFLAAGALADADQTGSGWSHLLNRSGITYVFAKTGLPDRPALAAAVRETATLVMSNSTHTLYCLCSARSDSVGDDTLYKVRDFSAKLRLHLR
ncbi:MAG: hypothetical protein H7255_07940 [Ramlibacter sp.]|nr:hypothetical protein [Ramlibacter sp.]